MNSFFVGPLELGDVVGTVVFDLIKMYKIAYRPEKKCVPNALTNEILNTTIKVLS